MAEYKQHAVRGQMAIDSVEDLRAAGILIRHHHENYDGSGFPDQLTGENIPVGARIITLADSIDRALSRNPGDNAVETTMTAIQDELEKRFDPGMFALFQQALRETKLKLSSTTGYVKVALNPKDLREGMIVAKEVRSGTGLLLLGEGECLDIGKIISLKRFYQLDPVHKLVSVLVKG
jgi:HD-GYP domain-containing protein (c-di-GMP phosphodiesterase class II)